MTELVEQLEGDHTDHVTTECHALDSKIHQAIYAAAHNPFLQANLIEYRNLTLR